MAYSEQILHRARARLDRARLERIRENEEHRRIAYERELLAEPDIIETDYPSEFIGLPWSRKEIHSLQDKAIKSMRTARPRK